MRHRLPVFNFLVAEEIFFVGTLLFLLSWLTSFTQSVNVYFLSLLGSFFLSIALIQGVSIKRYWIITLLLLSLSGVLMSFFVTTEHYFFEFFLLYFISFVLAYIFNNSALQLKEVTLILFGIITFFSLINPLVVFYNYYAQLFYVVLFFVSAYLDV